MLPRIWPYRERSQVVTDAAGRFTVSDLAGGFYELSAAHDDYIRLFESGPLQSYRLIDVVPGGTVSGVALGLGRSAALSGTVRDEAGEPVVKAEVTALRRDLGVAGGLQSMGTARTDDRGAYRIALRQTGDYLVFVRPGEEFLPRVQARASQTLSSIGTFHPAAHRPAEASILTIASGEERRGIDVSLAQAHGVTVSGVLEGSDETGRLLDFFLVPLDGDDSLWDLPSGMVRVPLGGRFAFSNVSEGRYMLSGVSFPSRTGRGNPLMQRRPWSPNSFGIIGMRPGEPVGAPPDGDTLWTQMPVTVGRVEVVDLAMPLTRGARIEGRVVFDGTAPEPSSAELQAVNITVIPASAKPLGSMPVSGLAADGTFRTVGLPPGDYRVAVAFETAVWRTRSVTVGGKDVGGQPVSLGQSDVHDFVQTFSDRRTVISGLVTDRSGRPFADQLVIVFPTDRSIGTAGRTMMTSTSQRGTFELQMGLSGGAYFVAGLPATLRNRSREPELLDALSRSATRVRIEDGQSLRVLVSVP